MQSSLKWSFHDISILFSWYKYIVSAISSLKLSFHDICILFSCNPLQNEVFMMQVYCFNAILSIKMLLKASVSPSLSRVVCCCYLDLLLVDLHDRDDNDEAKDVEDVVEGWQGSKIRVIFWTVDVHLSEGVLHFVELLLLLTF